jgi:hypothetical protein
VLSVDDVPVVLVSVLVSVLASVEVLPESVVVPELDVDASDCARFSMADAKSPP